MIVGWPCQGHSTASHGNGLHNVQFQLFWEMVRVLRHMQLHQTNPLAYILKNVPLLGDSRAHIMENAQQIRAVLGTVVMLDVAAVGSRAHCPRLWWTNLAPQEWLKRAYNLVQQPSHFTVDDILDSRRQSQRVRHNDKPPFKAFVNRIGQPRVALPTLVSFPASHVFRDQGPCLI